MAVVVVYILGGRERNLAVVAAARQLAVADAAVQVLQHLVHPGVGVVVQADIAVFRVHVRLTSRFPLRLSGCRGS